MKKISLFLITVLAIILMTGCVKSEMIMTINKNKSMDLTVTYALDSNLYNLASIDSADESGTANDTTLANKEGLVNRGYTVEDYNDGSYTGVKASKHIDNIDAISTHKETAIIISNILESDFDDSILFTVKKGFFKNTYTANFKYDLTDTSQSDDDSFIDMSSFIAGSINISYEVTLPNKPESSNSSIISDDGKTLRWLAGYNLVTDIEYSFELINTLNIIIAAGIAIIIIAVIILVIIKRKKI